MNYLDVPFNKCVGIASCNNRYNWLNGNACQKLHIKLMVRCVSTSNNCNGVTILCGHESLLLHKRSIYVITWLQRNRIKTNCRIWIDCNGVSFKFSFDCEQFIWLIHHMATLMSNHFQHMTLIDDHKMHTAPLVQGFRDKMSDTDTNAIYFRRIISNACN